MYLNGSQNKFLSRTYVLRGITSIVLILVAVILLRVIRTLSIITTEETLLFFLYSLRGIGGR